SPPRPRARQLWRPGLRRPTGPTAGRSSAARRRAAGHRRHRLSRPRRSHLCVDDSSIRHLLDEARHRRGRPPPAPPPPPPARPPEGGRLATALHAGLLGRLALRAGEAIIIVPHRVLDFVPFHALRGPKRWVLEEHAVSFAPSARAAGHILRRPAHKRGHLLAL